MIRTIEFPDADALHAGLLEETEETAYLDGLCTLEDRLSPGPRNLSREPLIASMRFDRKAMPHLANHLRECALRVDAAEAVIKPIQMMSTVVETFYLQLSMRDRIIDLFQFATKQQWGAVEVGTYRPDDMALAALGRDVSRMSTAGFTWDAIERTLGIDPSPVEHRFQPFNRFDTSSSILYPEVDGPIYVVTNSRGLRYYLNVTTVTPRGEEPQSVYYFSRTPNPETGTALPPDRFVREDSRNGSLIIFKVREAD